ncbi:hypothetical protein [Alteromonas ponticola]|uniref:RDD family protein n=1 Tax=Alteromonas ponticola TaxID=2720613 RepID=A0ABX1R4X3_9ALTE|nr:hypothetical protein [Alteromonas ponticola]NMH60706.1 hypothetical protein [Alteromonas ponticola]
MKDKHNLEQLWQQQPVQTVDLEKIETQVKTQRWKQRCYAVLDIASMIPIAYILLFMQDKMSTLAFSLVALVGLVALIYIALLIFYRRHAAFSKTATTQDYLHLLRRQIHNNVLIARLTRHFSWVVLVFMMAFYGILYWNNELKPERWQIYLISLVISVIGVIVCYVWAHRRERRFAAEAARLNALINQE